MNKRWPIWSIGVATSIVINRSKKPVKGVAYTLNGCIIDVVDIQLEGTKMTTLSNKLLVLSAVKPFPESYDLVLVRDNEVFSVTHQAPMGVERAVSEARLYMPHYTWEAWVKSGNDWVLA